MHYGIQYDVEGQPWQHDRNYRPLGLSSHSSLLIPHS